MFTLFVMPVVLVVMASALCGCGPAPDTGQSAAVYGSSYGVPDAKVPTSGSDVAGKVDGGVDDGVNDGTDDGADDGKYGVDAVAEIADMKADVEKVGNDLDAVVYTDDENNPYDVVWDYGRKYGKFVDAVGDAGMWDVLFDAEFYKEHYPMLALLYHDDDALLLEHFRTVGVHEGRQASEEFNVAVYMENCDKELLDAFGDHYECYYFYWALNQGSESGVDTVSDGHPLQMCVKLTALQKEELRHVNEYRAEVGVASVEVDPELLAWTNYRAWCDFTGDYSGHDWFYENQDYVEDVLDVWGAYAMAENTVQGKTSPSGPAYCMFWSNYRNSESHYKTMVNPDYAWFGCSNYYWGPDGDNGFKDRQYDVYVDDMSTYSVGE